MKGRRLSWIHIYIHFLPRKIDLKSSFPLFFVFPPFFLPFFGALSRRPLTSGGAPWAWEMWRHWWQLTTWWLDLMMSNGWGLYFQWAVGRLKTLYIYTVCIYNIYDINWCRIVSNTMVDWLQRSRLILELEALECLVESQQFCSERFPITWVAGQHAAAARPLSRGSRLAARDLGGLDLHHGTTASRYPHTEKRFGVDTWTATWRYRDFDSKPVRIVGKILLLKRNWMLGFSYKLLSFFLVNPCLLSQWQTFKLFGITYLVGKIKFKLLFHGPLAE